MIAFKHFIITQFNIRLWDKDKRNISTYTEEWLAKRFGLFDLYCFPSVKQQTNPHFIWICLFDANTPEKYKEKIKDYQKQCPQLKACFLNSEDTLDWLGYAKNAILQHIDPQDEYIVTTNLDNDDAIHLHTIDSISSHINKNPEEVLYSFNLGYQYFTEPRILLKMVYPHNHFLSLVEKNSPDFKTIKCMPHAKARKHFKTIDIKDEPFWIEFVHSSNVITTCGLLRESNIILYFVRYPFAIRIRYCDNKKDKHYEYVNKNASPFFDNSLQKVEKKDS